MNKMGFGFLRLPQTDGGAINDALLNQMVDAFLERGGAYFDTVDTYLDSQSELALRNALVRRHPRENYRIANKLPSWMMRSPQDCQRSSMENPWWVRSRSRAVR